MRWKRARGTSSEIVASIPILAVVGTLPGSILRLGSSGFDRALEIISTSRSACTRVATAHSTSTGSNASMSSSTTVTCFMSATESAAVIAFLPSPGCGLMAITACQWQHPPGVMFTAVTCTPASWQTRRTAAS